ncbi:MAG: glycosyltransferase family 41 protein [Alphaproteobacteria bacterium]|nr:glycosyltransferase family 41 protein [Alphaproteobacteria bacterium]
MNDLLMRNAFQAHQMGNYAEAARYCQQVLRADPQNFQALYLLGFVHSKFGHFEDAERLIGEAIRINPRAPDAIYNRGCMLQILNRHQEAIDCFEKALAIKPDFLDADVNRGISLLALKRFTGALQCFDRALKANADDAECWNNRANALLELQRPDEALKSLEKALTINPNLPDALSNRGVALHSLRRHTEALKWFDKALAVKPDSAPALNNRGSALMVLHRYPEALADFDRALALIPENVDALVNRGRALLALKRGEEAVQSFDRAVRLKPGLVEAYYNRASAFLLLKRFEEAARDCAQLLRLDPNYNYALGFLNHFQLQCCDWHSLADEREAIAEGVRAGARVIPPFANIALSSSPEEQLQSARICVNDLWPSSGERLWRGERYEHDRIRVAYLSGDFHNTPVSSLMAGVFERHDRKRFQTVAISFTRDEGSEMRLRLTRTFDDFIEVQAKSDFEVAELLRSMEIDIAVDLMGYTEPCRPGILALRPCPMQVNYLGFPGTTGADQIDYIVADRTIIPDNDRRHYSEQVVYLPDAFLPNDSRRRIGVPPSRKEAGLPENAFVFCSFNNSYKFSPETFDIWMRLLRQVRNSVLWLPQNNEAAMRNLGREAEARGIAATRLIFAPFAPNAEDHLARLGLADLFLDTLPYNAHTTACDALWAGLPVLTCLGNTFAGRVAGSVLYAAGLPELVMQSPEDYEALALRLARDPEALATLRAKLAANRGQCPLFDTERSTRALEAAFAEMWRRQREGESPAHFAVDPATLPAS